MLITANTVANLVANLNVNNDNNDNSDDNEINNTNGINKRKFKDKGEMPTLEFEDKEEGKNIDKREFKRCRQDKFTKINSNTRDDNDTVKIFEIETKTHFWAR